MMAQDAVSHFHCFRRDEKVSLGDVVEGVPELIADDVVGTIQVAEELDTEVV